ncbi:DUF1918 domain-containing protein [Streptomyces spororaveus]|uniref:DUF1918 domain-containing protein n=1 Tax=Streptomyces spororaveus TaxID=284039 RepID=UPI00367B9E5E
MRLGSVGSPGRDGEVIALHHDDGTPPYAVRWSDTGRTTVFFPGPDAHVRHLHPESHVPMPSIPTLIWAGVPLPPAMPAPSPTRPS